MQEIPAIRPNMNWIIILLCLIHFSVAKPLIQEKFKAHGTGSHFKSFQFGKHKILMGSCSEGSSLGIYNGSISTGRELFYACNIAPGKFTNIYPIEGLNGDSLPDFIFTYERENTPQLYTLYSISPTVYHFEFIKELLDGKTLELKPPVGFNKSQLQFLEIADVSGDGFPEVINNIFKKKGRLYDWQDISDTISLDSYRKPSD